MKQLNGFAAALAGLPWAMEPEALKAFFARLEGLELSSIKLEGTATAADPMAIIFAPAAARKARPVVDGVATVSISGTLMKSVPNLFRWLGIEATSYGEISSEIAQAVQAEDVSSIVLQIDSPGGQVAGVAEAAAAIASAASQKPVSAVIEDLGASAAYWLASQAKAGISTSKNAQVGSIGVYQVVQDLSGMAAQMGVKVHVISSGPHKGAGVPGAPISTEQLGGMQQVIDGLAANFVEAVAKGRGVSAERAQSWATGQVWLGQAARELGLVDSITSMKATAAHVGSAANSESSNSEETDMRDPKNPAAVASETPAAPQRIPATVAELRTAFPKDSDFALAQLEAGSTLLEAKAAYADLQTERLAKSEKENSDLKAAQKPKAALPRGAAPLSEDGNAGSETSADAGEDKFMAAAREYKAADKCDLFAAMSAVKKSRPDLFEAHIKHEERDAERVNRRRRAEGIGQSPHARVEG